MAAQIAGYGTEGERREPEPGRPDAVGVLEPHSGQVRTRGTSSRDGRDAGPGSFSGPDPVRQPGPGNIAVESASAVLVAVLRGGAAFRSVGVLVPASR